jgi:hypothetical protein
MKTIEHLFDSYKNYRIKSYKPNIYQIYSPYHYDDGDMFIVFIEQLDNNTLCLKDFGSTYMSMYGLSNIEKYDYAFEKVLKSHGLSEAESGEISLTFDVSEFDKKLNDYFMGITKLTSTEYFEKERNTNRFYSHFNYIMNTNFRSKFALQQKVYPLGEDFSECKIPWAISESGMNHPVFLFPVSGSDSLKETIIISHELNRANFISFNCSIYNNVDTLAKKDTKRANELFEKQINSLEHFERNGEKDIERMIKLVS